MRDDFDYGRALNRVASLMPSGQLLLDSGPVLFFAALENRLRLANLKDAETVPEPAEPTPSPKAQDPT